MKRVIASLLACTVSLLLLTACEDTASVPSSSVDASEPQSVAESAAQSQAVSSVPNSVPSNVASSAPSSVPDSIPAASQSNSQVQGPAEISVTFLQESTLDLTNAVTFTDPAASPEYIAELVISTTAPVKALQLVSLAMDENGCQYVDEVLSSYEELLPETPVIFRTTFYGDIPNRGFAYIDEQNQMQEFYIGLSGKDGTLIFDHI